MANQFTKYTGTVTGQAGSLITALNSALVTGQGWTTGTNGNRSWYRAPGGNQLYLAVDDSGVVTAKEARITGFEGLPVITSSPITGTNPFPTAAQNAAGNSVACVIARKSYTADATARAYQIFADTRTVYVFINSADPAGATGTYTSFAFGEIYSLLSGDQWNTIIIGRSTENTATVTVDNLDQCVQSIFYDAGLVGHYMARTYTGTPSSNPSLACQKSGDTAKTRQNGATYATGATGVAFPNPTDGGLYTAPLWVTDTGYSVRGRMRGLWHLCHQAASFGDGDTYTGTGTLGGKTFQLIKLSGNGGVFCIETSATLETN